MSGSHQSLASCAASLVPEPAIRRVMDNAIAYMLHSQEVGSKWLPGRRWRTLQGSGMGLNCSGDISDGCFAEEMEAPMPLNPDLRDRARLLCYLRYMDDIFMVFRRNWAAIKWFRKMWGTYQRSFSIDDWEFSMHCVDFLDLTIWVDDNGLQWRTHWKQTNLGVPLHNSSSHPPSVHFAWAAAEISRIAANSSSAQVFVADRQIFLDRLRVFFMNQRLIQELANLDPFSKLPARKLIKLLSAQGYDIDVALEDNFSERDQTYIVLPHHPLWQRAGIAKQLRIFNERYDIQDSWRKAYNGPNGRVPHVNVSWKLVAKPFLSTVRKLSFDDRLLLGEC